MKIILNKFYLLISFALIGCTTLKHPFYYRVESPEGGRGYILGTIHTAVPIEDLPKEIKTQLKNSNPINVETDLTSSHVVNLLPSSMIAAFEEDIEKSPISKFAKILIEYENNKDHSKIPPFLDSKEKQAKAEEVKNIYRGWIKFIQEKKKAFASDIKISPAEFKNGEKLKNRLSQEQWNYIVNLLKPIFHSEETIETLHIETITQLLIDFLRPEVEVTENRAVLLNPRWSMDRKLAEFAKDHNRQLLNLDSNNIMPPSCYAEMHLLQIRNMLTKKGPELMKEVDQMEAAYRSGNLDLIQQLNNMYTSPEFRECSLVDRNKIWITKIDQQIKNSTQSMSYPFFAFGVAHLTGEDNILKLLQQKNYKIERYIPQ